jgi:glutamyl-tRNA reductase
LSVVVVGINHRTVPLYALEPLIVEGKDLPKALADLAARPHLDEVAVLSTCMRTEVYAAVNRFHGAMADIREFFATWSGRPPEEFSGHLYSYFDEAAVSHLFRVASGIDSTSLGEPEILRQVRQAGDAAQREGASGPLLGAAFRHAVQVGKRARTETGISRGTTSLSHAAAELAAATLGTLEATSVIVVGLGDVGQGAARAFATLAKPPRLLLANRSGAHTAALAAELGAQPLPWQQLTSGLLEADIVVSAAPAEANWLSPAALERLMARRSNQPLLVIDLAVPRSVPPASGEIGGVTLLNMDDLGAFVATQAEQRRAEVPAVERIVAEELERYNATLAARTVAPLVAALHARAEELRLAELARLGPLASPEREAAEEATRRLVAKLLHEPTTNLKAAAGTPKGEAFAEALRELFGLAPS